MSQSNFWDRMFPPQYDFFGMITKQARITGDGVSAFRDWLQSPVAENAHRLRALTREADVVRLDMEDRLIEAFVTPFDRQDIYSLSVEMDRVIESVRALMELMIAYEVPANDSITGMVLNLEEGAQKFAHAVSKLAEAPLEAEKDIVDIRRCQSDVETGYRTSSAALFKTQDLILIMKYREIYRSVQDAAIYLGYTVDILHKIVVRIA